jgi:hypothetical protein
MLQGPAFISLAQAIEPTLIRLGQMIFCLVKQRGGIWVVSFKDQQALRQTRREGA